MNSRFVHTFLFFTFLLSLRGQTDTNTLQFRNRKIVLVSASAALTGSSLFYLQQQWYRHYHTGDFHFFNDNGEWLQMDKAGHAYSAYQAGRLMTEAFHWAGYSNRYALAAGSFGFLYLNCIEVMDGFSEGWGFSWGDEIADIAGTALVMSQEAAWKEQRFLLKFSYFPSGMARYNPTLLGENDYSRILKDYNGQTYWLSFGSSCFGKTGSKFPRWLNLSVGYGADGMTGGHSNKPMLVNDQGQLVNFKRSRSAYLSLDINLKEIKTRSRFLKTVFSIVNVLKFPAPAVELNNKGVLFHPVFY